MIEIRNYFDTFLTLSDQEWEDFSQKLVKAELPRKGVLLAYEEPCDFIAFVIKGVFRFYYVKGGEEIVTAFFFPGDFATNYRSFLTGQPSEHYIEALKGGEVYKLFKKDLIQLYDKHRNIERLGRLIAENLYLSVAKRIDSFMFETPEDRYNELLNRNSRLLLDVPQYMLASYLGVKPESLSRIRKRKT